MFPQGSRNNVSSRSSTGITEAKAIVEPLFCKSGHPMPQKKKKKSYKRYIGNLKPGELNKMSQLSPPPFSSSLLYSGMPETLQIPEAPS